MTGEKEFRQRIAALTGEEAGIACEIMLALHPNRYLNTLAQGYITMRSDNERIRDVIDSRENYIRIITGEIDDPAAHFEKCMNPPVFPDNDPIRGRICDADGDLKEPFYQDSLENGVELINEDDPRYDPVEDKEFKIPDLLGGNHAN